MACVTTITESLRLHLTSDIARARNMTSMSGMRQTYEIHCFDVTSHEAKKSGYHHAYLKLPGCVGASTGQATWFEKSRQSFQVE